MSIPLREKENKMKDEITPIEILKATPRNNCKECGFETCMAFATSLVRRNTKTDKCPYLEISKELKEKLAKHFSEGNIERKPGMNALTMLENKIKELDLAQTSENLKLDYESDSNKEILRIKYLDTVVELKKVRENLILKKDNGEEIDIYDKILVYNYIFFSGDKGLSGEWVGMESLPNSISKVKALEKGAAAPLREHFSGKLDLLKQKIIKYPHKIIGKEDCIADLCFVIYLFPMLPVRINFWDAMEEEDFEASVKFLYDKNAISYLDLESLVFASEKITEKLIEQGY